MSRLDANDLERFKLDDVPANLALPPSFPRLGQYTHIEGMNQARSCEHVHILPILFDRDNFDDVRCDDVQF